ncbi:putative UPF0481 protein At3g02645 [Papaver somniferum]|uniref:putative UPF0481 protein At3g02645 n=1 Tax=Papaver somniferum TaxID=3469 RepID=UPI000E70186F|nr:putative UPF0481 protein At3g02645 [Papaver somniferum]
MNGERVVADDGAKQITERTKVLAASIKSQLDKSIPWSRASECSIYRVPEKLRKIDSFKYTPIRISIGPFHHAAFSLFKVQKLRYARELLSRNTPIGTTTMLEECVECIKRIEDEVRKCYSEPINLSSDEFVELIVIDGLFIIELFRKYAHGGTIKRDDPILGQSWGLRNSVRNLLLLENQLPMVVLECLFNALALKKEFNGVSLNIIALQFLNQHWMPRGENLIVTIFSGFQGKHLLDLLGKTYFHNLPPKVGSEKKNSWKSIPSATELKCAGVKFAVGSTDGSFLDIKFKDGVMEIPPVTIKYENDTLLRNLIAYEQCCDGDVTYYMTSYGFLMDSLINSGKDVGVLRKRGIITNLEDDDESVAFLFRKKLCSEVPVANFYYSELCDEVNKYCKTRWYCCGVAELLCSLFS